jgi:hypothetical protein
MNPKLNNNTAYKSLSFQEFSALYETLAKRAAKEAEANIVYWLSSLQVFVELFWTRHLGLSMKELKEFGYINDVKQVLRDVKMSEAVDTIIYVGSNLAIEDQKISLTIDAYKTAIETYQKKCKDPDSVKNRVIKAYAGKEHKYAMKFLNNIPDEFLAAMMMQIRNTFKGLSKKEKIYLKKSLCTKDGLDECLVFDMADLYKKYLQINNGA